MRKIKVLSVILAAVMLISSVSMLAFAEDTGAVTDYESLVAAVANGGEVTVSGNIIFGGTITVTKDTTIKFAGEMPTLYMDNSYIAMETGSQAENMFVVEGATLTFNFSNSYAVVGFNGTGSPIKLVGADGKQTAFAANDIGSLVGNSIWSQEENGFVYPKSYIDIENPNDNDVSVELDGVSISVEAMNENGKIFSGDNADIQVIRGNFCDKTVLEYIGDNSVGIEYEGGTCEVLKIDAEPLEEVSEFLGDNGELVFKRPEPTEETEKWLLYEEVYYSSYESLENYSLELVMELFDANSGYAYIKVSDKETGNVVQGIKVPIAFEYEEEMIPKVRDIIDALPKGEETPEGYLPYCYSVTDLELFNFWLTCNEDNYYENINSFINYSDEFKKNLGYKNFTANIGYGADERLYTFCGGMAQFYYGGVSYGYTELEVKGEHIFYVPDETENTPEALRDAFQSRIGEYTGVGEDLTQAKYLGTALEVLLKDTYEGTRYEWEQYEPDMTFDEWKQSAYCPVFDVETEFEIEGITDETPIFSIDIKGIEHQFLIVRDSSKMVNPQYKNVDVKSDVAVELSNALIPLDTLINVDKLTSGSEYERIKEKLQAKESVTFDISLHSISLGDKITSVENGEFQVYLPIPEDFKGKDLEVCYVHENGQIEQFKETIENGYIKFSTNHFSAYTLLVNEATDDDQNSTQGGSSEMPETPDKPANTESPKTADTTRVELWAVLSAVSLVLLAATVLAKKKLEA